MKIQIELDNISELIQLDSVREALIAAQKEACKEAPKKPNKEAAEVKAGAKTPPWEEETAGEPSITLDDIQGVMRAHILTHKQQLKDLLNEYGVAKASLLEPGQYPAFYARLEEVTNEA